ncbi:activator of HSP90 ATPase [Flavobacterium noncentrifugens]|uniref:Uncharacterized conserved protein YndB, AHSA1/START domain n=1 Tax=Flavobacterium noncentrifugens TaxID=1128970 RepID=A0A1G9CRZ7_9FLAO|nr:SRPBCC family protein [Flavobacterium noncentrifugens]GEP52126.1 activator of HSP90 ATPase [Flavobacterium noncentrifugens]SDK54194.1 Uncharacterized conserved protein YndB, AHSA1/START domain [Flavobacterium noncentrifugens]
METSKTITVKTTVNAPVEKVWKFWSQPEHIKNWNHASPDWHTPIAENDFRAGGKFLSRMEAKDGSFGFDFEGVYDTVTTHQYIHYTMADGRTVSIAFDGDENETKITETFDPENQNPVEMQQTGWQMIIDNFKKYTEAS